MKDEEKWISNIRNRMDDYSEPLPEELWSRIEEDLAPAKAIPMWRRWQTVAAAVAVIFVSSLTVWFWSSPIADSLETQGLSQHTPIALEERQNQLQPVIKGGDETPVLALLNQKPKKESKQERTQPVKTNTLSVAQPLDAAVTSADVAETYETKDKAKPDKEESSEEKKIQARQKTRAADRKQISRNAYLAQANEKDKKQAWQVGIGAGNTPYATSDKFGGFVPMASRTSETSSGVLMNAVNDKATAYSQILFNNRDKVPQTEVNHKMPVTFGASVKWGFKENWALETGLTYTILSSESHSGSESAYMEEEWKLHYLGIPLKIHRSVWKNKRFHVYASAGGAVEKCVSGNLKTVYVTGNHDVETEKTSLDVNPLQWSLSAAAGAQVNFTSFLGLYVEPGIAYYFDDGSSVETFRKEHPLNFNLQLGLRYSFGK